MAIPPFPSHDLAKLVLGYLAEEQLMTAYDEFLQASPYLDVLKNEYDRIFMTSLKSILAEYRAVKIYVETCKPFLLRKKLFQCSNLLEVVKFLVNHVDINKLHIQDLNADRSSYVRQTSYTKSNDCEGCSSQHLGTCVCKPRGAQNHGSGGQPPNHSDSNSETSIETTSLADLPGNSVTKRSSHREPTDVPHSQSALVHQFQNTSVSESIQRSVAQQISQSPVQPMFMKNSIQQMQRQTSMVHQIAYLGIRNMNTTTCASVRPQTHLIQQSQKQIGTECNTQDLSMAKSDEAKQKIEEFNTIYNLVCNNNTCTNVPRSHGALLNSTNTSINSAGSFQGFSTGVAGNSDKERPIVPDSSTSENFNTLNTSIKKNRTNVTPITNINGPAIAQYFLRPGTLNTSYNSNQNSNGNGSVSRSLSFVKIKEKEDPKITIISDVKVDTYKSSTNNATKMPQVLRNTCNPMLQMQTIVINGAPAYTNKRQNGPNHAFTKDEIMAMPTIIVVPSSGSTHTPTVTSRQNTISRCTNTLTTASATPRVLGPLVVNVNSPDTEKCTQPSDLGNDNPKKIFSEGLVKTVDVSAISLPKDTNLNSPSKTSTPHAIPPTRKSCSTPRRNSHVRVLDFATPRRILHETIDEIVPNQQTIESVTENVPNDPLEVPVLTNILTDDKCDNPDVSNKIKINSTKEYKIMNKSNWDAELRTLVLGKELYEEPVLTPKSKVKKAKKKKKKVSPVACSVEQDPDIPEADDTKIKRSSSRTKCNVSLNLVENIGQRIKEETNKYSHAETNSLNINEGRENFEKSDTIKKNQAKVNTSDDRIDTPEAERLSLQNVIGAKLNISELLETPYKQALYDIQMETPKFLGAGLPDEPISDIKIMSIPTPLFLNTPKLTATPSYACRTTDYSSGSSYYKPDDHDYIPPSEVLQLEKTEIEKEDISKLTNKETVPRQSKDKEKTEKPSRPQRKCTRNVSYKSLAKVKDDESFEAASVSSDTSNRSIKDKKINKSVDSKARMKSKTKTISLKKVIIYKSPQKPCNFMKIKPRRATTIKESSSKRNKKSVAVENGPSNPRKRTTSKEKNTNETPVVFAAPTKSRRKSSTPRKLHCTKSYTAESVQTIVLSTTEQVKETNICHLQDSDNEQLALRWSDDGSQDAKPKDKEEQPTSSSLPEEEDINKIKEYIETSAPPTLVIDKNNEGSLHNHLVKRGFDDETAKIIERDLLDATPIQDTAIQSTSNEEPSISDKKVFVTVSNKIESDSSTADLKIREGEGDEEIDLSVHDCNEDSKNYVSLQFDESKHVPSELSKLKDKFSVELCIDDDLTIRLRANQYTSLFEMDPEKIHPVHSARETEDAVSSISNFDKLYTPMKDARAQCYEIFDSTLTSIDTPLKSDVACKMKVAETEIVLEVESIKDDGKEKLETKKRKRVQSTTLDDSLIKKSKPDTQYLLNSANIQNIDIESVLSKLHGP